MSDGRGAEIPEAFGTALGRLGPALLSQLDAIDEIARHMGPGNLESLGTRLGPGLTRLRGAHAIFRESDPPEGLGEFADQLSSAARHAERAAEGMLSAASAGPGAMAAILQGMREHSLAQAALFPLRRVLPPFDAWFIEPGFESRLRQLAEAPRSEAPVGFFSASNQLDRRGGFTLFVPEDYHASRPWPLVVALHGGFGHGAEFVWSWLREARARGWLLLAPTSRATTWSLMGPDVDAGALDSMLAYVRERWSIDRDRILLTGLSDGATYTLLHGLREGSPFTHLAPACGVLHPQNLVNGNLERASGRRIRLVHGTLDWMFPVSLAREAARALEQAGAAIVYDEIPDLAHAYPREINGPTLAWADATRGSAAGSGPAR
jgi:phospholipase/carboxylesterase